jgi:hypothetical protein
VTGLWRSAASIICWARTRFDNSENWIRLQPRERVAAVIVTIHERVKELKKSGRSLDEVIAEKPTSKVDAKWGAGFISPSFVTELVFVGA